MIITCVNCSDEIGDNVLMELIPNSLPHVIYTARCPRCGRKVAVELKEDAE